MIKRTYFISCDVVEFGDVTSSHWRVFDRFSWLKEKDGVVIESIILDIANEAGKSINDFNVRAFNRM
ncbi:hypothetical protein NVP1276O_15 [Vibrio phage 1.276.O._10N.286.54.E4]|nr:hypothetical protein NVP1276O_15 [Vibrio phage 1.276.O._10N.286.54.E4]